MLALQLAAQIAGGPDLLEVGELPTGPVIYLPAEDPPTAIHHRLHALGAHLSAEERQAVADGLLIQPLIGSLPNIMAPEWFDGLKRAAEGRRLMVLDTLRRFHIEEENASGPMAQVIGRMEAIAADTGCSVKRNQNEGICAYGELFTWVCRQQKKCIQTSFFAA